MERGRARKRVLSRIDGAEKECGVSYQKVETKTQNEWNWVEGGKREEGTRLKREERKKERRTRGRSNQPGEWVFGPRGSGGLASGFIIGRKSDFTFPYSPHP